MRVIDFRRGGGEGGLWGCRCRPADIENTSPSCEGCSGSASSSDSGANAPGGNLEEVVCDLTMEGPSDLEVFVKPFVELVPKTEKENGAEVSSDVVCVGSSSAARSSPSSSIIWTSRALSSIP